MRNSIQYCSLVLLCVGICLSLSGQSSPPLLPVPFQQLLTSQSLVGLSNPSQPPNEIVQVRAGMTVPQADMEFVKLYRYGSPVAKVYALIGLTLLNSKYLQAFDTDFSRKDQGLVTCNWNGTSQILDARQAWSQWKTDRQAAKPYTHWD